MTESRPDDFDVTARIPADDASGSRSTSASSAPDGADAGLSEGSVSSEVGGQAVPLADDPDPAAAMPLGSAPVSAAGARPRDKRGRPWCRRTWVAAVAVAVQMLGAFGAGWGVNELLSSDEAPGVVEQGEFDPRQGGPGGRMPGGDGRMPGGDRMPDSDSGHMGGGSGGAGRTTPDGGVTGGPGGGSEDGPTSDGDDSVGVLQEGASA